MTEHPDGRTVATPHCRLHTDRPAGLVAGPGGPVRVGWQLLDAEDAGPQQAFELQVAADPGFTRLLGGSATVLTDQQHDITAPGGPLRSREVRRLRVRARLDDRWTAWSPTATVEAGLLEAADWVAEAITLEDDPGRFAPSPLPMLRHEFSLPEPVTRARLYVTSLGVHEIRLNGQRVGDHLLDPGWTPYDRRLLVSTHDVTDQLRVGRNAIGAILGDGWYRGRIGYEQGNDRCRYGHDVALLAQLEIDLAGGTSTVVATSPTWRAATGPVLSADLYDGSRIDLRLARPGWDLPDHDDAQWRPARRVPLDLGLLAPRQALPVREQARLTMRRVDVAEGGVGATGGRVLDSGQNLAGWVRLRVRGTPGQTVTVRHAELLEPDGRLHTASLRSARATDEYVLADIRETVLEPVFTTHGFRYAQVETEAEILGAEAVAVSSVGPDRGTMTCDHPGLNRLHRNVRWSAISNLVSVPTDCPQRDERLGWTGDVQAFGTTACTMFDLAAFWRSWLADLALEQRPDGEVPCVVPDVLADGPLRRGRAGWADVVTILPWSVYRSYGDTAVLAESLPAMTAWVEHLWGRCGPDGLLDPQEQYGDWLDPDAPPGRPWQAKVDSTYVANAFYARSAQLLALSARTLGLSDRADHYAALAEDVAAATWERWAEHAVTTQTGCALAIAFDLAPTRERDAVGIRLARLVRENEGRIGTGFLGTPLVLPALSATGHLAEAFLMLLCRQAPSWLHQVDRGATTIWERWDALRPDGTIHDGWMDVTNGADGNMLSFNHYAYGAVMDWVYRTLAGLAPDPDPDPATAGYRRIRLEPRPVLGISWAKAQLATGFGTIRTSWQVSGERFTADYEIPRGVTAITVPPAVSGAQVRVDTSTGSKVDLDDDGARSAAGLKLGPGRHRLLVEGVRVVDPSRASYPLGVGADR